MATDLARCCNLSPAKCLTTVLAAGCEGRPPGGGGGGAAAAAPAPASGAAPAAPRGRARRVHGAAKAGAPRIVMGFGTERIDDLRAHDANMETAALERHEQRAKEGNRGRMRDADGRDLDRSAGGAWHVGRRS